jgi:hypothetical protein
MLMKPPEPAQVESQDISDFAKVMQGGASLPARSPGGQTPRINLDQDNIKNSLGQLVLTLVKLLHELLERQGIRRIEEFGLEEDDLNIDLGPLGQLL